jgi:hypothetical protein
MVQPDRTHVNITRRMCFECWITEATMTHSECVILLAFARQQRLSERASLLRYTYIACIVYLKRVFLFRTYYMPVVEETVIGLWFKLWVADRDAGLLEVARISCLISRYRHLFIHLLGLKGNMAKHCPGTHPTVVWLAAGCFPLFTALDKSVFKILVNLRHPFYLREIHPVAAGHWVFSRIRNSPTKLLRDETWNVGEFRISLLMNWKAREWVLNSFQ